MVLDAIGPGHDHRVADPSQVAGKLLGELERRDETPAVKSEAVKVGCVGGRRCSAYHLVSGRRVCRTWVACR